MFSNAAIDPHHGFSDLVPIHPWLAGLDERARHAEIETVADLHLAFSYVHYVTCEYLRKVSQQLIADAHLCRLLDDRAEFTVTEVD